MCFIFIKIITGNSRQHSKQVTVQPEFPNDNIVFEGVPYQTNKKPLGEIRLKYFKINNT